MAALAGLVDDFYFSALAHGRNDSDDELFPISDERYATELQLQEVITSSVVAATARSSSPPPSPPSSSSSPSSALAAELVFCKICMDAVPRSDAHRASRGCSHAFCGACLADYVGDKIQDRIAVVRCPEEMCGGALDPELCQGLLTREVFERWCAALCESKVLEEAKRTTYCPYKDCSAMMEDTRDGVVVTESLCPYCERQFCARCGAAPWHAGIGCEEYSKLGKGDRDREDMMLLEMAKRENWRRCPKCQIIVDKSDGCSHMICNCGFEFCYGCGAKWGVTHYRCSTA